MNSLKITPLRQTKGTVTSLNVVNGTLYFTELSEPRGSQFVPVHERDFSEIKCITQTDFLINTTSAEVLAAIQGTINTACLSSDNKYIFFIYTKLDEDKNEKNYLAKLDIISKIIIELGQISIAGNHLDDINNQYLLTISKMTAGIIPYTNIQWKEILPSTIARRSVFYQNGTIYYMFDNDLHKISKEEIMNGTFTPQHLTTIKTDYEIGHIYVDAKDQVYVTVYDKKPFLFNPSTGEKISITPSIVNESKIVSTTIFNYGADFYAHFWAADRPMTKDTRIIKFGKNGISETEKMDYVTYLGVVGDYLVFNRDYLYDRHSELFGIKYK